MGKYLDIARREKGNGFDKKTNNTKKSKKFLIYYLIIALLSIIFLYSCSSLAQSPSSQNKNANDSAKDNIKGQSTSNESDKSDNSPGLPNPEKTNTSQTTNQNLSSNKGEDLNKTKLTIKVLNGEGKDGTAASAKDKLEKNGFIVTETGNAKNTYNKSVIYYASGNESAANLIMELFNDRTISTEYNNDIVGDFDILVVIGKK